MFSIIKQSIISTVSAIVTIQAFAWVLGLFDKVTDWLLNNQVIAFFMVVAYIVLRCILYDVKVATDEVRYSEQIKNAKSRTVSRRKGGQEKP